jgi:predicted transglutaminase-like cysteine proteinase
MTAFAAATVIVIVVVAPTADAAPAYEPAPGLFGTIEVRSDDLAPFGKWLAALDRAAGERQRARAAGCRPSWFRACPYTDWLDYLDRLRGLDRSQQLALVNRYANRFAYVTDTANWGVPDYWETPGEFLENDGDCEDYAIVKYLSLRELGWSDDDLRLVTVIDIEARRPHAVLVAFADGGSWMLDNRDARVVDTRQVERYRPIYSVNARAWWRHRRPE